MEDVNNGSDEFDKQSEKEQKRRELKEQLEKSKRLAEEDREKLKSM